MRVPKLILSFIVLVVSSTLPAHAAAADYDTLDRVNWSVNRTTQIDCKGYAYDKLKALDELGIKAKPLFLVTETNGLHVVVVVADKWVLDNRYKRVVTLDEVKRDGYRWISQ